MQKLKHTAGALIADAVKNIWGNADNDAAAFAEMLEYPPDETMGHLAFPCFKLSRTLRAAPPKIAAELEGAVADELIT